ncbi:DUF3006 family protein [Sporosarcina sp. FSL K6-1508]|uniref:DUF3006 family protein n=1 Tax=Sporosarcina sp. FSL K6-1508 TaxID=2921553 RepID=UPI0030FAAF8F
MYSAYLDRFTDNEKALFLVEELQKEFHIAISSLPPGSTADKWFLVEVQEDEIISIQVDVRKSAEMKQEVENRMKRLKSNKTSRFKRN